MKYFAVILVPAVIAPLFVLAEACSSNSAGPPNLVEGGTQDSSMPGDDAGNSDSGNGTDSGSVGDGGFVLTQNPPVNQGSLAAGQLLLTASGESLASTGYNFPAQNTADPVFADGWQITFSHFIATFDKVKLWTGPDTSPTDQSQVANPNNPIAEVDGPWVVDLSQTGPSWPYVAGKEQGEQAVAFAVITGQNKNGNAPFLTDGTRYAVGFSAVVATPGALNVNLGSEGVSYYEKMVAEGCVALYVGKAQWNGDRSPGLCGGPPVDGGTGGTGQEAEFANVPKTVDFELCFKPHTGSLKAGDVETSWINCDNQDNDPAMPFPGEPHQRGIAFKTNTYVTGEVTFHTDHPFWESTKHDTPARFDQFAAAVSGGDGGIPTVHLTDVVGVDYTGFKDKQGNVLPWRTCDPNYQNPNGGSRTGQMHFDPVSVPHCTNNDSSNGLCDYDDFSKYNQSTQGHWNGADGLCFVQRAYPSPP